MLDAIYAIVETLATATIVFIVLPLCLWCITAVVNDVPYSPPVTPKERMINRVTNQPYYELAPQSGNQ